MLSFRIWLLSMGPRLRGDDVHEARADSHARVLHLPWGGDYIVRQFNPTVTRRPE